jgi:CBS domain-containing protein
MESTDVLIKKTNVNIKEMRVNEIMTKNVITIDIDDEISKAADGMWTQRTHSVVVLKNKKVAGIITSLDLVSILLFDKHFAKEGESLLQKKAKSVVENQSLVTIEESETIQAAITKMNNGRFLHLPVVKQEELVGIITSKDIIKYL